MGSIWSSSFFFAKVAFWKRGSGRDEEPSGVKVLRLIQDPFNDTECGKNLVGLSRQFPGSSNRRSKFQKRRQLVIRAQNETLSGVALRCGGDVIELERAGEFKK